MTTSKLSLPITTLSLSLLFGGCSSFTTSELAAVNKDWNKLIRASHIYPIYPLTQDLQPGDVFLTDASIESTREWEKKAGYIRFDHHIARLPVDYKQFYSKSFGFSGDMPNLWLKDNSWSNAPAAAFPTYSFSVKQGGGASVALPISGIPVALGLMGARSASGTVTIGDVHTYGITEPDLMKQVQDFVQGHQKELLDCLGSDFQFKKGKTNGPRYYLQVVSRVYSTGRVTVSMVRDSSVGGSVSGGAPKDVPIPDTQTTNAAANYSSIVSAVNTNLASLVSTTTQVLPGGTLKFSAVSSRSVSMDETFAAPVIIGYTGFSWLLEIEEPEPSANLVPGSLVPPKIQLKGNASSIREYLNRK